MNRIASLYRKIQWEYRIPLFLCIYGLVGVQSSIGLFFLAVLGYVFFIPVLISLFVLPILWVVGYFKKLKKATLWSKVGLLSIAASTIVPLLSIVVVEGVHDYQMDRLAYELDQYKERTRKYPKEVNLAAPSFLSLGIQYYQEQQGQDCTLTYPFRLLSVKSFSNRKGNWQREVRVD